MKFCAMISHFNKINTIELYDPVYYLTYLVLWLGMANRIFLQSTDARIAIAWDRLFDPEGGTGFTLG